jgi:hypothetical protein
MSHPRNRPDLTPCGRVGAGLAGVVQGVIEARTCVHYDAQVPGGAPSDELGVETRAQLCLSMAPSRLRLYWISAAKKVLVEVLEQANVRRAFD